MIWIDGVVLKSKKFESLALLRSVFGDLYICGSGNLGLSDCGMDPFSFFYSCFRSKEGFVDADGNISCSLYVLC